MDNTFPGHTAPNARLTAAATRASSGECRPVDPTCPKVQGLAAIVGPVIDQERKHKARKQQQKTEDKTDHGVLRTE